MVVSVFKPCLMIEITIEILNYSGLLSIFSPIFRRNSLVLLLCVFVLLYFISRLSLIVFFATGIFIYSFVCGLFLISLAILVKCYYFVSIDLCCVCTY